MLNSIWADIRHSFRFGNMVTRLIFINVGVFIAINLILLFLFLWNAGNIPPIHEEIICFFSVSADWKFNLLHPWVFLTNMFLHTGPWHLFWNMILFYWFGRILGDLMGDRHILPAYLIGGLIGGFGYFLFAAFFGSTGLFGAYAYGASAAVMGIIAAAGVAFPDYTMHLILIGPVRLKYIVMALIVMDLIFIPNGNTGGHVAHLLGAFSGWVYVSQMRQHGNDWSIPINRTIDKIQDFFKGLFTSKKGPKVAYRNKDKMKQTAQGSQKESGPMGQSHQEKLDEILDKIKGTGYESLSQEEKEFLFNASKK